MRFLPQCVRILRSGSGTLVPQNLRRHLVAHFSKLGQSFNTKLAPPCTLSQGKHVGLYRVPELMAPDGWAVLEASVLTRCEQLRQEVFEENRSRKLVEIFDDLSNTICCVADMAECVRQVDPDPMMAEAAERCLLRLHELVESLNTDHALYSALKDAYDHGDKWPCSKVEKRVMELLLIDFQISGVHLDPEKRKRFVELTQSILKSGNEFTRGADRKILMDKRFLPPSLLSQFAQVDDRVMVSDAKANHTSPAVREWAFRLYYTPSESQETHLLGLVRSRHELAKITGFPSYAHRALHRTMVQSPEAVLDFLGKLAIQLRPRAAHDYALMRTELQKDHPHKDLACWDVPYCSSMVRSVRYGINQEHLSPYFSLGTVMEGLNLLLGCLYGVEVVVEAPKTGEVWHDRVYKLLIYHQTEGLLGYIYCDLFARPGKISECHFTIRGGRQDSISGTYQLPVVTLALSFPPPTSTSPCLLSLYQVENLFHEMGHAMHTMLGRTQFQHVTGTRCSTDFAEVPSNLMEYFVYDQRILSRIARHYSSGKPLSIAALENISGSRLSLLAQELQQQLLYAMFDLRLHLDPLPPGQSTVDLFQQIHQEVYGLPYVPNTAWHHRFSHLVVYGSKYYSYLVAKAMASLLWQQAFKADPFSRAVGCRYRSQVLHFGGERPPLELIHDFLGWTPTGDDLVKALIDEVDLERRDSF